MTPVLRLALSGALLFALLAPQPAVAVGFGHGARAHVEEGSAVDRVPEAEPEAAPPRAPGPPPPRAAAPRPPAPRMPAREAPAPAEAPLASSAVAAVVERLSREDRERLIGRCIEGLTVPDSLDAEETAVCRHVVPR